MPVPDLRQLVKQERHARISLDNIEEFLLSYQEDRDRGAVDLRVKKLDEIYEKYCEVRVSIEVLTDDLDVGEEPSGDGEEDASRLSAMAEARQRENEEIFKEFENKYFRLKQALLSKVSIPTEVGVERKPEVSQSSRTRFPELKLPTFSGRLSEWINFRDSFASLIHDNAQLSTIDKFNYLRASLKDEALLQVNQIQVTSSNYTIAWGVLESKFENHKLIAQEHLKALFAVAPMKTESFRALNHILMTFKINLQQLEKLGEDTEQWSTLSKNIPSYKAMVEFLENHCAILQSTSSRKSSEFKKSYKTPIVHAAVSTGSCIVCNGGSHSVEQCTSFGKMKVVDRKMLARKLGLCLNCLHSGHFVAECSRSTCRKCGQRHHTLLHPYVNVAGQGQNVNQSSSQKNNRGPQAANSQFQQSNQTQTRNNSQHLQTTPIPSISSQYARPPPPTNPSTVHHTATQPKTHHHSTSALLSTAIVKLGDCHGNTVLARALLDSGSQISLITENLSQRLNFRRLRENLPVKGVGGSLSVAKQSVLATILSCNSEYKSCEVQFYVLSKITSSLPQQHIDTSSWNLPTGVCLADPNFNEPGAIDVILGVTVFYDLLLSAQLKLSNSGPILRDTELGWIVAGELPETACVSYSTVASSSVTTEQVFEELSKFWELESCHTKSCLSIEESACEAIFEETTARSPDGKFRVQLAKRKHVLEKLGSSRAIAKKRFISMERRLDANLQLKAMYTAFMHEYVQMGHMKEVQADDEDSTPEYFIPHHCVLKPDSTTTKLRVVFDASCPTDTGVSLNDVLMVGPVVQDDLRSILLRFRMHRYAVVGDAEKMYRMVPEQVRGRGCGRYPAAAAVVKKCFYVDDMLAGSHTIEEGKQLCKDVLELLKEYGFNLRKWNTNNPAILAEIPPDLRDEREVLDLDEKATVKTLGLTWEPAADKFWIKVPYWKPEGGSCNSSGKIFLQDLWKAKYTWDELLCADLHSRWLEFRSNLADLDAVSVPRWIGFGKDVITCEFHGFSDASDKAYGAVVYLRCVNLDGRVTVNLMMAKSKVAPLEDLSHRKKKQSTPRLELSAALLLAHLYENVKGSLEISAPAFFWTDSTIVKYWISSHPSRWQVFVSNRVSEIQHATKGGVWNHVPGIENPADIISRGATPAQLVSNALWWHGPDWLRKDVSNWPKNILVPEQQFDSVTLEERPLVSAALQALPPSNVFTLRSSLLNLVRLTAWIRRFSTNCQQGNSQQRRTGSLSADEHNSALLALVKLAQSECFPLELADIEAKNEVRSTSKLHNLHPVMIDGIICVGGRLGNAPISPGRRHPMILDSHHPLTKLILIDYHHRLLHGGPLLMIACVRERFWPLSVRNLARRILHECIRCFRARPRVHEQLMGDLPLERVSPAPAFQRVGIDYCGLFELQPATRKGAPVKCYLCLFPHSGGSPQDVEGQSLYFATTLPTLLEREDNCTSYTTFFGKISSRIEFQQEAALDSIEFKFIPARSPNFGGLWKAAVKSVKGHMRKVIGNRMLKCDEMQTVVAQIEACLNSRPLTPMSNDPTDLEVLTPGHFLIQRPLTAVPELSLSELPENRLSRWQRVQQYSQCCSATTGINGGQVMVLVKTPVLDDKDFDLLEPHTLKVNNSRIETDINLVAKHGNLIYAQTTKCDICEGTKLIEDECIYNILTHQTPKCTLVSTIQGFQAKEITDGVILIDTTENIEKSNYTYNEEQNFMLRIQNLEELSMIELSFNSTHKRNGIGSTLAEKLLWHESGDVSNYRKDDIVRGRSSREAFQCAGVSESIADPDRSWKCAECLTDWESSVSKSSRVSQKLQLSLKLLEEHRKMKKKRAEEEEKIGNEKKQPS
ncbi:uncharacterized protein LOC134222963 [Armigeres subalbatus]|uniref:uncharacterized protein LOC134222963 n=1 Tax=Armigeres subalbatus TaxID=124917 RepID=UPI002ED3ACA3